MKVLIIDEQILYADGIEKLLLNYNKEFKIDYAPNCFVASEKIETGDIPNLIILGVNDSTNSKDYDFITKTNNLGYHIPIIISSTTNSSQSIAKAIESNASGFISKCFCQESTLNAIISVINGDMYFCMPSQQISNATDTSVNVSVTSRQQEILILLSQGLLNKQIASELDISANTVKVHIHDIFRKLEVTNRTAAVINGQKYGLI